MPNYKIFGKKAKREEYSELFNKLKLSGIKEKKIIERQARPGGKTESGIETREKAAIKKRKFETVRVGWAGEIDYQIDEI